ncbi:MAG: serine hydrolase [Pseudomonadota bacterium]
MNDTQLSSAPLAGEYFTPEADCPSEQVASVRDLYAGRIYPQQQVSAFSHIERLFPSRRIARGPAPAPLIEAPVTFEELRLKSGGRDYDLYDVLSLNRVAALLVLKDDRICFEHYEFGLNQQSRWMSMSIAKSISSTLVGIAIAEGLIESIDDPLEDYLPQLRDGAYQGVGIRQLLRMCSGVDWLEDPTDPESHRSIMLELQLTQQPGAILAFMSGLKRIAPPGTRWNYSTGETHIVGELLRAATGESLADYASSRLWVPLGMEADASWWLESPGGLEVAGSGISATLRDYARFGLFALHGGKVGDRQMVPASWFADASSPFIVDGVRINYGYQWWPVYDLEDDEGLVDANSADTAPKGVNKPIPSKDHWHGAFMAAGLFGQHIYIHPRERVVVVLWSAQSKPLDGEVVDERAFFNAVVRQLKRTSPVP